MAADQPAHSPIGASGYYRWKNCPGSVRLARNIESTSSEYAQEGSEAHAAAEATLAYRNRNNPCVILTDEQKTMVEPDLFGFDDEFIDAFMVFVDHMESLQRPGCTQMYERRFHLGDIDEECFGTADGVTYYPDEQLLIISDYKHGAGVFVDVEKNKQLLYYALGAVLTLGWKVKTVRIEIIQPRIDTAEAIRPWECDIFALWEFAEQLREDVAATKDPHAPLAAGEWCRWCPAAPICPLLKEQAKLLTKKVFKPVGEIDYADLGATLKWLPVLEHWITSTREFAYREAMKGKKIPGQKLVNKRQRRKFKDEQSAATALSFYGIDDDDLIHVETKYLSPAQVEGLPREKVPGLKKDLKVFVEKLVDRSQIPGLTLVDEDDDRPEAKPVDPKSVFNPTDEPDWFQ